MTPAKKNSPKRAKKKETISSEEFEIIISLVKGKPIIKERRRLAIAFLYLTGLRISHLLSFNVGHGKDLFKKGITYISAFTKGKKKKHRVLLSCDRRKFLLQNFKHDFVVLSRGKTSDMPLFTALADNSKPLSRETLTKELNAPLKNASEILRKRIRTHTLRATFIINLIQNDARMDHVSDIIGHKDMSTTNKYKQSLLLKWRENKKTIKEKKETIALADKAL